MHSMVGQSGFTQQRWALLKHPHKRQKSALTYNPFDAKSTLNFSTMFHQNTPVLDKTFTWMNQESLGWEEISSQSKKPAL